jgi:hypothetical protein
VRLKPATIYLDEAGHIYLPLLGPASSCLRLNQQASLLWRRWISDSVAAGTLTPPEKKLLDMLLGNGSLARAQDVTEAV